MTTQQEDRLVAVDPGLVLQVLPAVALLVVAVGWIVAGTGPWRLVGVGLAVIAVLLGVEIGRACLTVADPDGVRPAGGRRIGWSEVARIDVAENRRGRSAVAVTDRKEQLLFGETWRGRPVQTFETRLERCRQWVRACGSTSGPRHGPGEGPPAPAPGSASPRRALPPEPGRTGRRGRRGRRSRPRDGLGARGRQD